jgi:hypothetical protein
MLFGPRGATWVYYSWFVTGVIGLALSLYSLAGVEAGMMMEPVWNVGDATRLMLHADKTWSGPGGWVKTIFWAIGSQRAGKRTAPSCLWFMLALPSMLVFIAWPLSGLTMEITQGYRRPYTAGTATMTGFFYDTINERNGREIYDKADTIWKSGQEVRVPGAGIIYTLEGFDRSTIAFLDQVPAVLPKDDGIPELFLAAQADQPIEGRNWGLLLQYNCSVITRAQDFRLINMLNRPWSTYSQLAGGYKEEIKDNGTIYTISLNQPAGQWARNLDAVAELAIAVRPGFDTLQPNTTLTNVCYFKDHKDPTADYPGVREPYGFELALLQRIQRNTSFDKNLRLSYNFSIDHNITNIIDAQESPEQSQGESNPRRHYPGPSSESNAMHQAMLAAQTSTASSPATQTSNGPTRPPQRRSTDARLAS